MHQKPIAYTKALPGFKYAHGNRMMTVLDIPAGLRCTATTKGNYFLDEFPSDLFPNWSILRHDAEHYGIALTPDQVTFEKPNSRK